MSDPVVLDRSQIVRATQIQHALQAKVRDNLRRSHASPRMTKREEELCIGGAHRQSPLNCRGPVLIGLKPRHGAEVLYPVGRIARTTSNPEPRPHVLNPELPGDHVSGIESPQSSRGRCDCTLIAFRRNTDIGMRSMRGHLRSPALAIPAVQTRRTPIHDHHRLGAALVAHGR